MKRFSILIIVILSFYCAIAQKQLPSVKVTNLKGESVDIKNIMSDSIPVVLTFWSTSCKPCISELDAFNETWEDVAEEVRFKIVAISTDDNRSSSKVKSMVKGRNWPFTIYLDSNQALKRSMNVVMQPQLFILDKNGKVVYSHTGYIPLSEENVYDKLRELKR